MKLAKFMGSAVAIAVAAASSMSPAVAQQSKGGLYVFHTRPNGGCPGLDWHITVAPSGSLVGFVAWDEMKHMARLQGNIAKDGTFDLDAQEVGGNGRKAMVKGTAAGEYIEAAIMGSGTACDNKMLQIPRDVGGLEGGGG